MAHMGTDDLYRCAMHSHNRNVAVTQDMRPLVRDSRLLTQPPHRFVHRIR